MRARADRRALPLRSANLAQLAPITIMVLPPRGCPRGGNIVSNEQEIKDLGTPDRYGVVVLPKTVVRY